MGPVHPSRGARAMVAGIVLLRDDRAALLQLRDDKPGLRKAGMWVFPGGHCDNGESIEECARREMLEETGYRCARLHWLTAFVDDCEPEFPAHDITFFWERFDGTQSFRCLEGQALQFVPRNEAAAIRAPDYLLPVWDLALEKFAQAALD